MLLDLHPFLYANGRTTVDEEEMLKKLLDDEFMRASQ